MAIRIPLLTRYARWLHTRWPAGGVERLPVVDERGATNVPNVYLVGDLARPPLLKFSADSGTRVIDVIAAKLGNSRPTGDGTIDVAIIGAGVSGIAAALAARGRGLTYVVLEAAEAFSTIVNFPKGKPIFTYPKGMTPAGELQFDEQIHPRERLLDDVRRQADGIDVTPGRVSSVTGTAEGVVVHLERGDDVRARAAVIAIGRSGDYRTLGVPGESMDHVSNRLHDPADYAGRRVLVVGGGDSALEAANALADAGAAVTLSYRGTEFARAKPENVERAGVLQHAGRIDVRFGTTVRAIRENEVELIDTTKQRQAIPVDNVFTLIGREPPTEFLRRSGVKLQNQKDARWWITLTLFFAFCVWMYHWKKGGVHVTGFASIDAWLDVGTWWSARNWFPANVPAWWQSLGGAFADPSSLLGVLKVSLGEAGFYYSLAYCLCVVGFGVGRIRRRRTPYVTVQTVTLAVIQVVPLFLLPYVVLPWMGNNGWFDAGVAKTAADALFPIVNYGHGREYWRAFGLILAWPLFIWNVFTAEPMWTWLAISVVQTFVIIPVIVYLWGKGAYCGWICSCGALAETLGDRHRHKMPHGPNWNRFNMLSQAILAFALVLLALRVLGWGGVAWAAAAFEYGLSRMPVFNYAWFVDLLWAGIFGVGLYFWFSGRVWCRFACPLAALMHIYHRWGRFAILADKKRCISCNVCTSVCHQGIDVMAFANKGKPMLDPQCVRCSACVQMCPTGVLSFGQVDGKGLEIKKDPLWLTASPVHLQEQRVKLTVNGKGI